MHTERIDALEQMLSLSPKLADLCKPLFTSSPIVSYGYSEYHQDGTTLRAYTDKALFEQYLDASIPVLGEGAWLNMKGFPLRHKSAGFSLWDLEPRLEGVNGSQLFIALESAGFGHVCSLLEKPNNDTVRAHQFIGRLEDSTTNDFHINNTNMLRYFARYISKELQPHIRYTKPFHLFPEQLASYTQWIESIGESGEISIPRFLVEYAPHTALSQRQKELVYWSIMGKTNEEIALILGLKLNTVKRYFDRIKIKFQCTSKSLIIAELLKNGACFGDLRGDSSADTPKDL